jgi:hypothetical protein
MNNLKWVLCGLLTLAPVVANAHGGGVGPDGCHSDSETGTQHCHTDPPPDTRKVIVPAPNHGPLCDKTCWTVALLSVGFMVSVIVWAWYPSFDEPVEQVPVEPAPKVTVFLSVSGAGFTLTW